LVVKLKVTGAKGLVHSMGKIVNWANIIVSGVTFDEAEWGKDFAKSIAPHDTYDLINAIGTAQARGNKGFSVVSRMPKGHNKRNRPYHMFMHGLESPNTSGQHFNGDPRYMFTTFDMLRKRYPKKVQESLDKAMKK